MLEKFPVQRFPNYLSMARTLREKLLPKQEQEKASAHKPRFSPSPDDPAMNWTAPRRSFELKGFSKLKESFRLFANAKIKVDKKAAGLKQELGNTFTVDPPRFSCDGIGESKYLWKEPPRRSLDARIFLGCKKPQEDDARSYEPPRRSLDVNMLHKSYYSPDCPGEKQRRPNVVARLMGLEDLPESHPRPTKQAPGNLLQDFLEIEETKKTILGKNHLKAAEKPTENVNKSVRNYSLESNEQKSRRVANSPGETSLKEEKSLYAIEEASMQKVQRIEKIQLSELFKQSDNAQKVDVRGNADFTEERRSLFKGLLQFKAPKQQQQLQTCGKSSQEPQSSKPTSKMLKAFNSQQQAPKVSIVVLKSVAGSLTEQGLNSTQRTRERSDQADEACIRGKNSRVYSSMQKAKTKVSSRTLPNAYHAERRLEPVSKPSPSLRATATNIDKEEIQTSSYSAQTNAKHNKLLNLMKPTIASSGRQLQQRSVRRDRIIAPKKKPEGSNKKKGGFHGSPSRDQSESRAALLNVRNISSPTKMMSRNAPGGKMDGRLEETDQQLDAAGNSLGDDNQACRKMKETCLQLHQLGEHGSQKHGAVHKFQAIRTCIEESPEHVSESKAVSPKVEQASRSNSDMFDNLSPVSVLDLRYNDEYELFPNSTAGAGTEDQVRKPVEFDKVTADSHSLLRQLLDVRATVFDNAISCGLPKQQEEQQCSEHWSVIKQCKRCIRETGLQLESAIFDNLVYETMIQLDAQHIKTSLLRTQTATTGN